MKKRQNLPRGLTDVLNFTNDDPIEIEAANVVDLFGKSLGCGFNYQTTVIALAGRFGWIHGGKLCAELIITSYLGADRFQGRLS